VNGVSTGKIRDEPRAPNAYDIGRWSCDALEYTTVMARRVRDSSANSSPPLGTLGLLAP